MSHTPHIGSEFSTGLNGHKIAVVGWSHHLNGANEVDDHGTDYCIKKIVSGEWAANYFSSVRNIFGFSEHAEFWKKIIFFNYLPDVVGSASERYGNGTSQQRADGAHRLIRLLHEFQPDQVFILTSRHWAFPPVDENCLTSFSTKSTRFTTGTYSNLGYKGRVFFLRHPQGAPRDIISNVIREALA